MFKKTQDNYSTNPYSAVDPNKICADERQHMINRITKLVSAVCKGEPAVHGLWRVGKMLVSVNGMGHPYCSANEHGWYRWKLPGVDGVVRLRDPNSPAVNLSPSGAILWTNRDTLKPQRLTFEQLFARCEKLAVEILA